MCKDPGVKQPGKFKNGMTGYSCPKESSRREFTLYGYLPSPPKFLRLWYLCVHPFMCVDQRSALGSFLGEQHMLRLETAFLHGTGLPGWPANSRDTACLLVPSSGSKVQSTVHICLHGCWGPNSVLLLSTLTTEPLPQALEGPSF